MRAIIKRIIKQMLNDKRSLAMILLAPVVIMMFMYVILGESNYQPKIALVNVPPAIEQKLDSELFIVEHRDTMDDAYLIDESFDAIIGFNNQQLEIRMLESDAMILGSINKALQADNGSQISFIHESIGHSTFENLIHILLSIYSFFLVFLISGIAFVRERTLGTLERFMLSPISRYRVVAGFIIGYGLFAMLQSAILLFFLVAVLKVTVTGSILAMIVIMVLLAFVAIAIGALVSTIAKNEFQVIQLIPIILTPQIFFSGIITIRTLPYHMDKVAQLMPLKHAASALHIIISRGGTLNDVTTQIGVLSVFFIILYFVNVRVLKKYRSI